MEVSVLLQKLDSLNEEGKGIQNEIQSVDAKLAKCKMDTELAKQQVVNIDKELDSMSVVDEKRSIALRVDFECVFFY